MIHTVHVADILLCSPHLNTIQNSSVSQGYMDTHRLHNREHREYLIDIPKEIPKKFKSNIKDFIAMGRRQPLISFVDNFARTTIFVISPHDPESGIVIVKRRHLLRLQSLRARITIIVFVGISRVESYFSYGIKWFVT